MYCLWWAWQDALCFFSRAPSFIYDAGAGLGEGFDIIKGSHDMTVTLSTVYIVFLSSPSTFLFQAFPRSHSPLSLFFIYLYNATQNNSGERQKREHAKCFSLDKSSWSTSGSNCSGVTLWTEHHLFILLISRWFNVYCVVEIWSGIDPAPTLELLSWPDSGLFDRNESWWLFGNGRCKCCLVLGVGLCWAIASGPSGYQVKATWWQAGWWFAPENEKVITVSGWVKY